MLSIAFYSMNIHMVKFAQALPTVDSIIEVLTQQVFFFYSLNLSKALHPLIHPEVWAAESSSRMTGAHFSFTFFPSLFWTINDDWQKNCQFGYDRVYKYKYIYINIQIYIYSSNYQMKQLLSLQAAFCTTTMFSEKAHQT